VLILGCRVALSVTAGGTRRHAGGNAAGAAAMQGTDLRLSEEAWSDQLQLHAFDGGGAKVSQDLVAVAPLDDLARYMTATRWLRWPTTARSWDPNGYATPVRSWIS
jgi:hypothetical protein